MTELERLRCVHRDLAARHTEAKALHAAATEAYARAVWYTECDEIYRQAVRVFEAIEKLSA